MKTAETRRTDENENRTQERERMRMALKLEGERKVDDPPKRTKRNNVVGLVPEF